jgi:hypothetical protein
MGRAVVCVEDWTVGAALAAPPRATVPVPVRVVNVPAAGVVPPSAGGVAAFAVAKVPSPVTCVDGKLSTLNVVSVEFDVAVTSVAAIEPEPVAVRLAPVPTTIAAAVLVPPVNALNAELPPPTALHTPSPRK